MYDVKNLTYEYYSLQIYFWFQMSEAEPAFVGLSIYEPLINWWNER